ncbi:MAG: DNA adenine methylase [Gemmatimonadetes bacterium]|nr:DNA adenine methylase [Gemmatimonadota bacterium]
MIKYLGSKRTLVPRITALARAVREHAGARTVADLFTGTTRVAQALKREGFEVTANDLASYSEVLATCYIEVDGGDTALRARLVEQLAHLDALEGVEGYVTRTFCEEARYFQPFNGRRIDAIRGAIDAVAGSRVERAVLLTALLLAADRVDSTTGLQMAYLKSWAPRSHQPLQLRLPELIAGTGRALREDANALVPTMAPVDLAYIDPPYNQHSYYSNYHVWETIVRDDAPAAYGVARKREDCRTTKSRYNVRGQAWDAFAGVVRTVPARHVIVSFNDEGYFAYDDIRALLAASFGEVAVVPVAFRRYVGAKIGIHNPSGVKVGRVSHLTNHEFLFVAGPGAAAIVDAAEQGSLAQGPAA